MVHEEVRHDGSDGKPQLVQVNPVAAVTTFKFPLTAWSDEGKILHPRLSYLMESL